MTRLQQFLSDRGINGKSLAMGGAAVALIACGVTAGTVFGDEIKSALLETEENNVTTVAKTLTSGRASEFSSGHLKIKPLEYAMVELSDAASDVARQMKTANCIGIVRSLEGELEAMSEVARDDTRSPMEKFTQIAGRLSEKFGVPVTLKLDETERGVSMNMDVEKKPRLTSDTIFLAMQAAGCAKQLEASIDGFTDALQETANDLVLDEETPVPTAKPI